MKKQTIIIALAVLLISAGAIGGGIFFFQNQSKNNDSSKSADGANKNSDSSSYELSGNEAVTYKGEDGATALALLEKTATVVTNGTGENAFVTSINGVAPGENQFWAFYVNGTAATVGAGSYVTKSSDTISWQLESF